MPEVLIRAGGIGAALVLAGGTALLEALYSSLRAGGTRLPVSVLAAVILNAALVWFVRYTVGARWAPVVPAAAWFLVMLLSTYRTSEGDVLMAGNNPVALATLMAGLIAYVVAWWSLELRIRSRVPARMGSSIRPL